MQQGARQGANGGPVIRQPVERIKQYPPRAGTPRKSAYAARKAATAASAFDSDSPVVPRLDNGPVRVAAMAAPTAYGVCVPPGPSK